MATAFLTPVLHSLATAFLNPVLRSMATFLTRSKWVR